MFRADLAVGAAAAARGGEGLVIAADVAPQCPNVTVARRRVAPASTRVLGDSAGDVGATATTAARLLAGSGPGGRGTERAGRAARRCRWHARVPASVKPRHGGRYELRRRRTDAAVRSAREGVVVAHRAVGVVGARPTGRAHRCDDELRTPRLGRRSGRGPRIEAVVDVVVAGRGSRRRRRREHGRAGGPGV